MRLFSSLITTRCSWGKSYDAALFLAPSKKRPSPPLQFGQEQNIPGHSFERGADWFVLKTSGVFPITTGRVESGWWTFLQWLALPPYVWDSSDDKYLLAPSKKGLPYFFSLDKKRIYLSTHLRSTRVFSISTSRVERGWLTLC